MPLSSEFASKLLIFKLSFQMYHNNLLFLSFLLVPAISNVAVASKLDSDIYYLVNCVVNSCRPKDNPTFSYHSEVAYYATKPAAGNITSPSKSCSTFIGGWKDGWEEGAWENEVIDCNFRESVGSPGNWTLDSKIFTVKLDHGAHNQPLGAKVGWAKMQNKAQVDCYKGNNQILYAPFNTRCNTQYYCTCKFEIQ